MIPTNLPTSSKEITGITWLSTRNIVWSSAWFPANVRRKRPSIMNLMTSDECPTYKTAIAEAYGEEQPQPRTGRRGRPRKPKKVPRKKRKYATVHKVRRKGRVVKVKTRVVFGTWKAILAALAISLVSKVVNISFVERQNGTDRNRNRRKVRKTYGFSKDWKVHESMTYFTM